MMKKYAPLLVPMVFWSATHIALAGSTATDAQCPQAAVRATNGQTLVFGGHKFQHGVYDLVISRGEKSSDIKRVTYSTKAGLNNSSETCIYKAVAISQGGDWGWHLAWTLNDKPGVYYSRMDGEAWVSTPAKRISDESADVLELTVQNEQVTLRGYANQNNQAEILRLTSDDEGRNW